MVAGKRGRTPFDDDLSGEWWAGWWRAKAWFDEMSRDLWHSNLAQPNHSLCSYCGIWTA